MPQNPFKGHLNKELSLQTNKTKKIYKKKLNAKIGMNWKTSMKCKNLNEGKKTF
jgi:hypothetical protein